MPAAVNRSAEPHRARRADRSNVTPHLVAVDDFALLAALPIAAAIIERTGKRKLSVTGHNERFVQTVNRSACTASDWNEADCL